MTWIIAADLGATKTAFARWNGRAAEVIPIDGEPLMPSVITILPVASGVPEEERFQIGLDAIEAGRQYRRYCFRYIKRYRAALWHGSEDTGSFTCQGKDRDGNLTDELHFQGPDDFTYAPTELEAALLSKGIRSAEEKYKRKVTGLVITVPANASKAQRDAAVAAAKAAGVDFVELMDESTAAALAYGFSPKGRKSKRQVIAVLDKGGLTTDVSIIEVGDGVVNVLGTSGSGITGGSDWDKRLATHLASKFAREHPDSNIGADDVAMALMLDEAEQAKIRLSRKTKTPFRIDDIDRSPNGVDLPISYEVDRTELDELAADLLERMRNCCRNAIADAKRKDPNFSIRELSAVVLVGGGTRMPAVQQLAREEFGQEPKMDIDPEVAVVLGAAIRAAQIEGHISDLSISDITSHNISIEIHDKVEGVAAIIIPRGTPYPSERPVPIPPLTNREAGQTMLPVRIVFGDSDRATECEVLHAFNIQIEPGGPRSAIVKLDIALNARGEPFGMCGDHSFGDAA